MGKVDTRIFATGRKNMVAKGVTHIFLHHFTAYPLEIKKERKERGREKNLSALCVLKINPLNPEQTVQVVCIIRKFHVETFRNEE